MGWNTYYGVGGSFDQETIASVADALIDSGLARAGYRIVWLDYGWASGARERNGQLIVDSRQWPRGLSWLTAQLHARGLLAGIYTDAGRSGCDGRGVGSLGHYQRDAERFAAWGFDAVKVDFCGAGQERLDPIEAYADFARALRSCSRPMLLNVCNFWRPGQVGDGYPPLERSAHGNYAWAPRIAESWRTDTDVGFAGRVAFDDVLRNLDANAAHPEVAGPGHWNDPDYLAPELGMSADEARAQLTIWAIMAAPLVIGSDVRRLSAATVAMLANSEVIAVDQDPLGRQGTPVTRHETGEVWRKPLAGGDDALALLNRGRSPLRLDVDLGELGQASGAHRLRDLWSGSAELVGERFCASVPARGARLFRITAT
jgi:alpha-galactosidase